MSRKRQRHGQKWTPDEIRNLRKLARGKKPTRVIAVKLRRTRQAVQSKASRLGISLAPWNRPPRRPKR